MSHTDRGRTWWVAVVFAATLVACGDDDGGATPGPDAGDDAAQATQCEAAADCDDGAYCNGTETCDPSHADADAVTGCVRGVLVACDDQVSCTLDRCDETTNACVTIAPDADGDGHEDATCLDAEGVSLGDDCDDDDAARFPGNPEVCDPDEPSATHDEDCDPETYGSRDVDGDDHVDSECCNPAADGTMLCGDDCNDMEVSAYEGALEICDGLDNDCDPTATADNGLFCGACMCSVPNAAPSCTAGPTQCTVGVCDTGYLNCDQDQDNGCESRRDQDSSCGECGTVCTTDASCSATGNGTFACACDDGFVGDGVTCTNINECATDNGGCDSLTTCTDAEGGYLCSACPAGYTGDGAAGCDPTLISLSFSFAGVSPIVNPGDALHVTVPVGISGLLLTPEVSSGVSVAINSVGVTPNSPWSTPTLLLGDNVIEIEVAEGGRSSRTYTLTITRGGPIDYLKPSNTEEGAFFGGAVAIDGNTLVVGSDSEWGSATGVNGDDGVLGSPNAGAAYVFVRNGNSWVQQAYLKASNAEAGDYFGWAVAIDGDTIAVSAGAEASAAPGDPSNNDEYGAGAVYIFVRSGTTWTQQAYLKAAHPESDDAFGDSIGLDGDTLVVGAGSEDGGSRTINGDELSNSRVDSGAAYVFVRSGTTWTQQAYLKAGNGDAYDYFGYSVDVSGHTVVVGAGQESSDATTINGDGADNSATDSGAAYVFARSGTIWTQQAYLKASYSQTGDYFGVSVAIDGDTIVVGAPQEDASASGINPVHDDEGGAVGAAYVFDRSGGTWSQTAYIKASNAGWNDEFGISVAIDGEQIVVGASGEAGGIGGLNAEPNDDSASSAGAAYAYNRVLGVWTEASYLKAPAPDPEDYFGFRVAIDQGVVLVGAVEEDSGATGVNGNQANNLAPNSGAAYVFR